MNELAAWQTLANEALSDAGEWKRNTRKLERENYELKNLVQGLCVAIRSNQTDKAEVYQKAMRYLNQKAEG